MLRRLFAPSEVEVYEVHRAIIEDYIALWNEGGLREGNPHITQIAVQHDHRGLRVQAWSSDGTSFIFKEQR